MEADRPSPDEIEPTASDEHDGPSIQTRSYDCTFCKRGFSNAQALGGHMNIHRKDRAKLKQPSPSQNQFSAVLSDDNAPSYPPPLDSSMTQTLPGSDDGRFISQWSWMAPSDRHHHPGERTHDGGPRQQLPLFVDRPSRGYDRPSGSRGEPQGEMQERSGVGEDTTGLDLELRLGPEPTDRSTTDHKDFV